MILVIALLMKAFAAVLADERFKSGVNAHVRVERRRPVERFTARRAFMRLLRRVNDFVTAQSGRLTETFTAHFADKWSCSRVHRHVSREVVVGVKHFATIGTSEDAILVAVHAVVVVDATVES